MTTDKLVTLRSAARPSSLEGALLTDAAAKVVEQLLREGCDLDTTFCFRMKNGSDVTGTALAAAVALCSIDTVQALLEGRADIHSQTAFSWTGGLFDTCWQGPVAFACVMAGRKDMLSLLAEFNAKLDGHQALLLGKPRGTLLYEASCNGKAGIVGFMTRNGVDVHQTVTHPDDPGLELTPLHAASRGGYVDVALLLIAEGADVNLRSHVDTSRPSTPLAIAVENGQFQMVQLLIESSADLWSHSHSNLSHIDLLFEKQNLVTIAAAASGLQKVDESMLQRMGKNQFVRFLSTPGEAPLNVLRAVYRPRTVKLWKQAVCFEYKTAHITRHGGTLDSINVAAGPDGSFLDRQFFKSKSSERKLDPSFSQQVSDKEQEFLNTLLPQSSTWHASSQEPIDILQCILPSLHIEPDVFFALARCPSDQIFDDPACQAIVLLGWFNVRSFYFGEQVVHFLQALVYLCASVALNTGAPVSQSRAWVAVLAVLWTYSLVSEALQFIGFLKTGRMRDYFSTGNCIDVLRLALTLYSILTLLTDWEALTTLEESQEVRLVLALSAFLRWLKVLSAFRVNSSVGPRMLPILSATQDVVPFMSVVIFPLIGFTHFYYLLSFHANALPTDLLLMYRLTLLNDYDFDELGGGENDFTFVASCVRILIVVATFGMATIMMNIFIGVLGESYASANETRDRLFVRTRAEATLNFIVRLNACQGACSRRRRCAEKVVDFVEDECWEYVWYCNKSKQVPQVNFVDDDAEMDEGQRRVLAEVTAARREADRQAKEILSLKTTIEYLAKHMTGLTGSGPGISRSANKEVASF